MNFDKNTVIGFVLIGVLMIAFFWQTNKQNKAIADFQQHQKDSIARVNALNAKPIDTAAAKADSIRQDSSIRNKMAGNFNTAATGQEQTTVIENDLMKVTFSNKGGQVKSVELKGFKSFDGKSPVVLSGGAGDDLGYAINTASNTSAKTSMFSFIASAPVKNADGSQSISYTLASTDGKSIVHQYTVRPNNYMIDWNIALTGAPQLLTSNLLNLHWSIALQQQQPSFDYEIQQARLCFVDDNGYDYERATKGATRSFATPVQWFSFKQQFFNATIISKDKFKTGTAAMLAGSDTTHQLFQATADVSLQVPASNTANVALQLYFGPNDYHVLNKYGNKMDEIVDLGSGITSFVKYINRWIIMPVFGFFAMFIKNYGWVIALLTLFIRLVTSPLTYSSYLSGAKMKVLRPELDVLKKKFGSDQQGFAMEQMKLFREAGVNPLGGCIPALLQIPIFLSLYSFFNSNIQLRGQSFLWAKDLSSYDSFFHFNSSIWLVGDHVGLFTLTAIITSFLISIYNMSMTPTQDNPAMKYMPYFFPIILFFVFNKLPSALTWYYTVSNLMTLGIQFVIQNYIIDHNKILAQIDLKRKSPKTKPKSKWQERYEQMMESQKKLQDLKKK